MEEIFPSLYVQGYTAALLDVQRILSKEWGIEDDLKHHHKRMTIKSLRAILDVLIDNRVILRENPDAFIRYNDKIPGNFEIYIAHKDEHGKWC